MKNTEPVVDAKLKSKTHLQNIFFILAVFSAVEKSAKMIFKKILFVKGIKKRRKGIKSY
jgi:hypothetical protein